jgi:hypothetical protein
MDKDCLSCTDACKVGLGTILMQKRGVIAYASCKIKDHEGNYETHYLDLTTVIVTLKLLRHYLIECTFELKTNYQKSSLYIYKKGPQHSSMTLE